MVMATGVRIVFFGTPDFAVPSLRALLASRHPVVGVVTQPDRPRGRGQKPSPSPVKRAALEANLPLLQPDRLKDEQFVETLRELGPELGVIAAYGKIIPEVVIATPPLGLINVHASLLPRYRGAAPVHRAVLAGEVTTGVTIMRIVRELDAGAMFAQADRPIPPDATSDDVERDLADAGAALLIDVVDAIAAGTARETPQDPAQATYAPKIAREEGVVDWTRRASDIHNQVRGLVPWPRAWAQLEGHRIILVRTRPESEPASGIPGEILEAHGEVLRVGTGEGTLRILELQPEGRRPLTAREFLAGHPVSAGARFT
jgi:methionyl-tRNA formyltransferase